MTVTRNLRHSKQNRCPVCDGADQDTRGQGKRCSGFTSADGEWCRCSREDHAGALSADGDGLFRHRMRGECRCGETHGAAIYSGSPTLSTIEKIYPYRDELGVLLYEVVRKIGKRFLQRVPDVSEASGWSWKIPQGMRRVPYHLPELLAASKDRRVFIVEGEKDVETLERHGEIATCNPGGEGKWRFVEDAAWKALSERTIIVIADADDVGRRHAFKVYNSVKCVTKSVVTMECPAPFKDVSDFLSGGGKLSDLIQMNYSELPDSSQPEVQKTLPKVEKYIPKSSTFQETSSQDDKDWRSALVTATQKDGTVRIAAISANVSLLLQNHEQWSGIIAYDAFAECIITTKRPPWDEFDVPCASKTGEWTDVDTNRAVNWLARYESMNVPATAVEQAISVVAHSNVVHPVRDYLRSLVWDGKMRTNKLLSTYANVSSSPYVDAIGVRWMISCVARIMQPGCQVDCTIILEGEQGWGKTSFFRALGGEWYSDTGINLGDKDSYQNLRGVWIYGLDELDSLKRGETTKWKTFLSQTVDRYRPSFARRALDFLRQNGFCGTTNESAYFSDSTGNRRFWPARLRGPVSPEDVKLDRDQLWAEAVARYDSGEHWHVDTPELRALCEEAQSDRMQEDPWKNIIASWLEDPTGEVTINVTGKRTVDKYDASGGVLTSDVIRYALEKRPGDITKGDQMRVAEVLRSLGYNRGQRIRENGTQVRRYRKGNEEHLVQGEVNYGEGH